MLIHGETNFVLIQTLYALVAYHLLLAYYDVHNYAHVHTISSVLHLWPKSALLSTLCKSKPRIVYFCVQSLAIIVLHNVGVGKQFINLGSLAIELE